MNNLTPENIWELAKAEKIGYVEYIRRYNLKRLSPTLPSRNPSDYILFSSSYARESENDRAFRLQWLFKLLSLYGCKCAVCGSQENGFHLDHHWIPKNYGGEFIMKMKNGTTVCNAVPLCSTCNIRKSDSLDFSSPADNAIAQLNLRFTAEINGFQPEASGELYRFTERDIPFVLRRCGNLYHGIKVREDNILETLSYLNKYVGVYA